MYQPQIFLLARFSCASTTTDPERPTWSHFPSNGSLFLTVDQTDMLSKSDLSPFRPPSHALSISDGSRTLEHIQVADLLAKYNARNPKNVTRKRSNTGQPVVILVRSPLLAIRYRVSENHIRRIQLNFMQDKDFEQVCQFLINSGLPVQQKAMTANPTPPCSQPPTPISFKITDVQKRQLQDSQFGPGAGNSISQAGYIAQPSSWDPRYAMPHTPVHSASSMGTQTFSPTFQASSSTDYTTQLQTLPGQSCIPLLGLQGTDNPITASWSAFNMSASSLPADTSTEPLRYPSLPNQDAHDFDISRIFPIPVTNDAQLTSNPTSFSDTNYPPPLPYTVDQSSSTFLSHVPSSSATIPWVHDPTVPFDSLLPPRRILPFDVPIIQLPIPPVLPSNDMFVDDQPDTSPETPKSTPAKRKTTKKTPTKPKEVRFVNRTGSGIGKLTPSKSPNRSNKRQRLLDPPPSSTGGMLDLQDLKYTIEPVNDENESTVSPSPTDHKYSEKPLLKSLRPSTSNYTTHSTQTDSTCLPDDILGTLLRLLPTTNASPSTGRKSDVNAFIEALARAAVSLSQNSRLDIA